MIRYVAKPETWFDAGTEVELLDDLGSLGGIFGGRRAGKPDEEVCPWDEFDVVEDAE